MRIGVVPYFNALPLYRYLPYPVSLGTPAELEALMQKGELDIALLPTFSFLKSQVYRPYPELGVIQSDGPVESVLAFCRDTLKEPKKLTAIDFTTESRTSVALFLRGFIQSSLYLSLEEQPEGSR
jgi:predicted solute-binding protein